MSQKIKLDFEIPQGYYTQEELNNYIKIVSQIFLITLQLMHILLLKEI